MRGAYTLGARAAREAQRGRGGAKHTQGRRKGSAESHSTRAQRKGNAPWGLGARKRRCAERRAKAVGSPIQICVTVGTNNFTLFTFLLLSLFHQSSFPQGCVTVSRKTLW